MGIPVSSLHRSTNDHGAGAGGLLVKVPYLLGLRAGGLCNVVEGHPEWSSVVGPTELGHTSEPRLSHTSTQPTVRSFTPATITGSYILDNGTCITDVIDGGRPYSLTPHRCDSDIASLTSNDPPSRGGLYAYLMRPDELQTYLSSSTIFLHACVTPLDQPN